MNGDLFLIKIANNWKEKENENENVLNIYLNSKSIHNELIKQKLRVQLLKNERDRLKQQNRETNNNLKKDPKMIDILHKYNEIKDHSQILMGELLKLRTGAMIKDLYPEFGLELTD